MQPIGFIEAIKPRLDPFCTRGKQHYDAHGPQAQHAGILHQKVADRDRAERVGKWQAGRQP